MENLRLHEESQQIQMENLQMMRQTQQTTNILLAALMKMNPDLLQALPTPTLSAPLVLESMAYGSLLSGSSTREAEATQLPQREGIDPITPAMVPCHIQDDGPMSSAMHPSHAEERRLS